MMKAQQIMKAIVIRFIKIKFQTTKSQEEMIMKLLMLGVGGVGESMVTIMDQHDPDGSYLEQIVLADYNADRAAQVAKQFSHGRFVPEQIDATDNDAIIAMAKKYDVDYIINACDPSFVPNVMDAAADAGCNYMDFTCSWGVAHPEKPYELPNIKVTDLQYDRDEKFLKKDLLAIIGVGVEPGMNQVLCAYANKYLFDKINEIHFRDGANLYVPGLPVSFGFSIDATIEECLNPPLFYDKSKGGFYCTEPFSEEEIFDFPVIGPQKAVSIEHEEVAHIPRYYDVEKCSFKYVLGDEFINCLNYLKALNLSETEKTVKIGDSEITPVRFVSKCAPNPAEIGKQMVGQSCAGVWIKGIKDGLEREIFIYQVADNAECLKKFGCQVVVAQTAFAPAIAVELLAKGLWDDKGVRSLDTFDPDPFVKRMEDYGFPVDIEEMDSEYKKAMNKKALLGAMEQ